VAAGVKLAVAVAREAAAEAEAQAVPVAAAEAVGDAVGVREGGSADKVPVDAPVALPQPPPASAEPDVEAVGLWVGSFDTVGERDCKGEVEEAGESAAERVKDAVPHDEAEALGVVAIEGPGPAD
jgi:hypothetical protein